MDKLDEQKLADYANEKDLYDLIVFDEALSCKTLYDEPILIPYNGTFEDAVDAIDHCVQNNYYQ